VVKNRYFPDKDMGFSFDWLLHIDFMSMLIAICSAFIKLVCHFIDVGQSKSARVEALGLSEKKYQSVRYCSLK